MNGVVKVSIIIPCYNSEKYIEDCVLSALEQTWDDVEVILVDNESKDDSVKIVKKIQGKFPSLIIDNAKNIYPNCWDEARQRGFELMTGDYVLVMGSDDILHPKFIENCMLYILSNPDKIMALQSPMKSLVKLNEDWGIHPEALSHSYKNISEFKNMALEKCPVNTPTVIYNTKLYKDGLLTGRPEIYGGAADYDLYCKLADCGILIYPANRWTGFYYRWHEDQATWKVHKEGKNYDQRIQHYWGEKWKTQD